MKEEPWKEIAAAREESKRDLNGRRGVRVGKERGRRDEKARQKQRGIPRAPSTQGGSSLCGVGVGLSSHPIPSSLRALTSRGFGRLVWGGDTGWVLGRESFLGHFTSTSAEIERLISGSICTLRINAGSTRRLMEI